MFNAFVYTNHTWIFPYLFGLYDFRLHLVMTAAVSVMLALVVVLIIAMDWPFRGEVSISPTAFVRAQLAWRDLSADARSR